MATKTQTSNQSQNHIKIAEDLGTGSKHTLWVRAIACFKKPVIDADQREFQAEEERLTQGNSAAAESAPLQITISMLGLINKHTFLLFLEKINKETRKIFIL